MERSKLRGFLHHVEIYVSDLARTKDFYGWLLGELGYAVVNEWPLGISYGLGQTYFVFVQVEEAFLKDGYHRKRVGLNHLAFHVDSRQEVDNFTEQLRARGATVLYEDRHPYAGGENYYAVFFEDPDRMKLELAVSSKG